MGKGTGKGKGKGGDANWSFSAVYEDWAGGDEAILCNGFFCLLYGVLGVGFVITMIVMWAMSVKTIDSQEVALPYDKVWGELKDELLEEGMHGIPPFGDVIRWPKTYETMNLEGLPCNSKDGVEILVWISFQYLAEKESMFELTKLYKDVEGYKTVLYWRSRSAIRHACAKFTTQEFQTMRAQVQGAMLSQVGGELSLALDPLDNDEVVGEFDSSMATQVFELQLTMIERPAEYEGAVTAKENARNDIDLATTERQQALTQAQTALLEAMTEANRTINAAQTQAAVISSFAASNASAVTEQYAKWASLYDTVKSEHSMTTEALLAYIGNRLMAELPGVTVNLESPAYTQWKSSLSTLPSPTALPSPAPSAMPTPAPSPS